MKVLAIVRIDDLLPLHVELAHAHAEATES